MEIKDSLLTPKTSFAMKANLANKEPGLQQKWIEEEIYQTRLAQNEAKEKFVLLDGPPYANGDLHLGHAMNKVIKDFIVRYKSMSGYQTPIILGWDTHGLPIENALLKNKKINKNELTTVEFRQKCREYALKQVANQKEQFLTLGLLADGKEVYTTLEKEYVAEQIRVFNRMVQNGLIYKGEKPIYWSPTSQSALAEAEIEYQDKESWAIYVKFPIKSSEFSGASVVIWTTTPWTLPANQGVAVHKDYDYSLIEVDGEKLVIASDLVSQFSKEIEKAVIEKEKFKGSQLIGLEISHPIFENKKVKIAHGDHVTIDAGTGCVHTAPGHGEDDHALGLQMGWDVVSVVDAFGKMTQEAGKYEGEFYEKANPIIVEDLKTKNLLVHVSKIKHSYPHDWRTKKPVIYRTTPQWFASIEPIRTKLLTEIEKVNWINSWGSKRLTNMIKDRYDWCISRQRQWGVPLPIFYTEKDTAILEEEVIEHVAKLFQEHGADIWYQWTAKELLPKGYTHIDSPNGEFSKEKDIMDVWFDSGTAHSAVGVNRLGTYPSDLYMEGSDQYRGWFNSSLITGVASKDQAPYKTVLSHGFVLDGKGQKMSKSLGNIISPKQIINRYGADVLRLWVATVDYQSDVRISDEILKQVSETYRRFRNTIRFLLGNLSDYNQQKFGYDELEEVDIYILMEMNKIIKEVNQAYENYEYKQIIDLINNFFTNQLSSFYLDFIKDILYIEAKENKRRRQIQYVLKYILDSVVVLLTPIMPHTMEEVNKSSDENNKSIMLFDMPKADTYENQEIISKFTNFLDFRTKVNKALEQAREEKKIGKALEASLKIKLPQKEYDDLQKITDIEIMLIVSNIEWVISEQEMEIEVSKYTEHRCERCWRYYQVEELTDQLCQRCADVLSTLES